MSDQLHSSTEVVQGAFVAPEESYLLYASLHAEEFYAAHPDVAAINLPNYETLKFFREPGDPGQGLAEIIQHTHTLPTGSRGRTWYVLRPGGNTDVRMWTDDVADERALEESGDFPGMFALVEQKKQRVLRTETTQPVDDHSLKMFTNLLRQASVTLDIA
ncbi:MAG TPA: hypothetical protein VN031_03840 [Candidatus Microsaccharimonas sp.]|nr:hypothetical protein [Candidatus Microsaccharimonas sp.]